MLNRGTVQSNWTKNIFHISICSTICSTTWSYAPHSRTQPFLLHGCFSDGLGSQLARTTDYGTVVAFSATTHKLSGTAGSRPLGHLSLGPTLVSTNRLCILRQQCSAPRVRVHDPRTVALTGNPHCQWNRTSHFCKCVQVSPSPVGTQWRPV